VVDLGQPLRAAGLVLELPGLRLRAGLPLAAAEARIRIGVGYVGSGAGEAVVEAVAETAGGPARATIYTNVNMSPGRLGRAVLHGARLVAEKRGEAPLLVQVPQAARHPYLVAIVPSGCSLEARLGYGPSPGGGYAVVDVEPGGLTSQPPPGRSYGAVIPLWRQAPGGSTVPYRWVSLSCRNGYRAALEARVYEAVLEASLYAGGAALRVPVVVLPEGPPLLLR